MGEMVSNAILVVVGKLICINVFFHYQLLFLAFVITEMEVF